MITLRVGQNSEICGETGPLDESGHITCDKPMPLGARPTATPIGILKHDATGFQVFTMWYAPAADGCDKGKTYFTIHEVSNGAVSQRVGALVAFEPVTSPVVLRGQIMIFGANGAYNISGLSPDGVTPGLAQPPGSGDAQYMRLNWTELLE
jgi:hypothetical protein